MLLEQTANLTLLRLIFKPHSPARLNETYNWHSIINFFFSIQTWKIEKLFESDCEQWISLTADNNFRELAISGKLTWCRKGSGKAKYRKWGRWKFKTRWKLLKMRWEKAKQSGEAKWNFSNVICLLKKFSYRVRMAIKLGMVSEWSKASKIR